MKNLENGFKYFLLIPLALVLTACPFTTRDDEEVLEQKQVLSTVQRTKADSDLRYNELEKDIRVVAGKTDALDHNLQVVQGNSKQEVEGLKKTIDAQNEKIKLMQAHMDATETRLTAAINALSGGNGIAEKSSKDEESAAEAKPSKKKVAAVEANAFDEADAFLSQKDFKKAIVGYKKYLDKNPKGKHVPEASYKIGVCFAELGLKQDAKEFYKDVIETYPGTPWAKKAKLRLSQLK